MRIKAAGTALTVAELQGMLEYARDDAEVLIADVGNVIGIEAGAYSVELEVEEVIDRDAQAEDHFEFVELIATGKLKTLKDIKARAKELNY